MKKMILFMGLLILTTFSLKAQNFEEWFQQKKTQRKYLQQQIAALQVYIGYAQKGYDIAKEGLTTISVFTKGEFNLHTDYFNSLKSVNPQIKRHVKVAEIIALQIKIVQNYKRDIRRLKESKTFSNDEIAYIGNVFNRLLDDCQNTLEELITITTDGKFEMKDDERIAKIDKMYLDMQSKYEFSQRFTNEAAMLAASRIKEKAGIQSSRLLYGIKK